MGRYYEGDIDGKFEFGTQASNAADRFGVKGEAPGYLEYYFDESDLPGVKDELKNIVSKFGEHGLALETYFNLGYWDYNNKHHIQFPDYLQRGGLINNADEYFDNDKLLSEFCDYLLGYKIMKCIEETSQCSFTAEL
jgi:hypothetical protein